MRRVIAMLFAAALLARSTALAHTLPISFLTLVADADYLHLELVLNPFELNFFSELDANRNRQLEPSEVQANLADLTRRISETLKLTVAGKRVRAESAGFTPDLETHHLAFRAHYRVDARDAQVSLETSLAEITSGSHVTHVTFGKGAVQQARLDLQTRVAKFNGDGTPELPAAVETPRTGTAVLVVLALVSLPAMALMVVFPLLLRLRQKRLIASSK